MLTHNYMELNILSNTYHFRTVIISRYLVRLQVVPEWIREQYK